MGDFDWNDRRRHFHSLKESPQFILCSSYGHVEAVKSPSLEANHNVIKEVPKLGSFYSKLQVGSLAFKPQSN